MARIKNPRIMRRIRHMRIRQKIQGTSLRPRLALFRSLNHVYAQVIDDTQGVTLVAASSLETTGGEKVHPKSALSIAVGKLVAERALAKGITQVVFDRGGFKYHGRVKALAEASKEGGLQF